MKRGNLKSWCSVVIICCAMLLFCFSAQVSGQEDATALMLEMTPPQGGNLNIVPGVHSYDRFAAVTLVATPKPGYQFVYWLGSVTNSVTGTTTVVLDSPKMVIAVFERNVFETVGRNGMEGEDFSTSGDSGGGGGGLTSSGGTSDSSLEQAEGGKRQNSPSHPPVVPPPTPVPEPLTAALFSVGFLMLAKSRRNGANITKKT